MSDVEAYGWAFHLKDDSSDKFYRLAIVPATGAVVINHGRAGGAGQSRRHLFGGAAGARSKIRELTREKDRKGYLLVQGFTTIRIPRDTAEELHEDNAWKQAALALFRELQTTEPDAGAGNAWAAGGVPELFSRLDATPDPGRPTASTKPRTKRPRVPRLPPAGACVRPNGHTYFPRAVGSHKDVALLRSARAHREHVLLYGPPGTGKNALAEAAFADTGLEIVTGSADLTETDLLGTFVQDPATGAFTWVAGPLPRSVEAGVPLFVDEVMLIEPRVLSVLYPLMDPGGVLRVPMNPSLPPVPVPDGWLVIAACNPDVDDARMSEALRSRFFHHLEIGTDWALAQSLGVPDGLVRAAANLDAQRREGTVTWSPQMRELLTFKALAARYGDAYAADALIAACPADDREIVQAAVRTVYPKASAARLGVRYNA